MNQNLDKHHVHPTVRLQENRAVVMSRGQRLFDFGVGEAGDPTPAFIRQALIDAVPEVAGYPKAEGTPALREAAAGYVARRFGVDLDPVTEVLPTAGSKEAIFHLPLMLLDKGGGRDVVIFGEPAYAAFRIGTAFAGGVQHPVPLRAAGRYILRPEDVPSEVLARTAILFLNYPHNPTGTDLPDDVWRAWVEARNEYGFTIVSDEVYCDTWSSRPPRSLIEFGREGCLAIYSLSKRSGMTGYLTGFLAGDPDLVAFLKRHRHGMGVASPVWIQAAAAAAWNDDAHAEARRLALEAKRKVLIEGLTSRGLSIWPGNLGLFLWAGIPEGANDIAYAERLLEAGIVVAPGTLFGEGQERFIRLALNGTPESCAEAMAAWPDA